MDEEHDPMSVTLSGAVADAIGASLAANDAYPIDFVGIVRYMRTDPTDDDGTYRAWAIVHSDGLEHFGYAGLVQALLAESHRGMAELVDPDQ